MVPVQVSIEVRFNAKVRKNHPGRQAGFPRKLMSFNGIGHLWGALREQEVPGGATPAPRARTALLGLMAVSSASGHVYLLKSGRVSQIGRMKAIERPGRVRGV